VGCRQQRPEGGIAVTSQVKAIPLLGVLSAAPVGFGGMLGPGYLYFFTALAVLMNLGTYFFSDRIVLAIHEAREAAPEEAPRLHAGFR
jgi:heat shock protein HtpX